MVSLLLVRKIHWTTLLIPIHFMWHEPIALFLNFNKSKGFYCRPRGFFFLTVTVILLIRRWPGLSMRMFHPSSKIKLSFCNWQQIVECQPTAPKPWSLIFTLWFVSYIFVYKISKYVSWLLFDIFITPLVVWQNF